MRVGSEVWDNGNTTNSDGCKTSGSDGETSNIWFLKNVNYQHKSKEYIDTFKYKST